MQESDATYDRRAFPLCRPTDCSKGAECERFKTEFINGAQRIEMVTLTTGPAAGGATLEYCLDDILLGMYPTSGVAGAPAGTLNAENTHVRAPGGVQPCTYMAACTSSYAWIRVRHAVEAW